MSFLKPVVILLAEVTTSFLSILLPPTRLSLAQQKRKGI